MWHGGATWGNNNNDDDDDDDDEEHMILRPHQKLGIVAPRGYSTTLRPHTHPQQQ